MKPEETRLEFDIDPRELCERQYDVQSLVSLVSKYAAKQGVNDIRTIDRLGELRFAVYGRHVMSPKKLSKSMRIAYRMKKILEGK
jgi:hypothetical protein